MSSAIPWLHGGLTAALLMVLAALLFAGLRAARYSRTAAAMLASLGLLHPAFTAPASNLGSVLFAFIVYGMAVTALAFARSQDPRRIILLGTSLAGAQLVSPVCGAFSTVFMPLVLRNALVSRQTGGTTGQMVSVLFIPILTAATMIYLQLAYHEHLSVLVGDSHSHRLEALVAFLGSAVATAPVLIWIFTKLGRLGGVEGTICALCGIVVVTGTVDALLGLIPGSNTTAAIGPLALVALSNVRRDERRFAGALLLMLSCVAAWWAFGPLARLAGV